MVETTPQCVKSNVRIEVLIIPHRSTRWNPAVFAEQGYVVVAPVSRLFLATCYYGL
jgi:hypothetical protein